MNSLAFFLTLALFYWADRLAPVHLDEWIQAWFSRVGKWCKADSRAALVLALGVPVILAIILLVLAGDWMFGLPALILGIIYLWVALGRTSFRQAGVELVPVGNSACSLSTAEMLYQNQLYGRFQSLFLVLFWALLLTPVTGLLVYLLTRWLARNPSDFGFKVLAVIEWLPARMMVLSFAAVGNFSRTIEVWKGAWFIESSPVDILLVDASHAALGEKHADEQYSPDLNSLHSLLVRVLVLWLVLVAFLVLI